MEKEKELDHIRELERDKLFLCFRKFYEDNQKKLFNLQAIDRMLVQETASCVDRLVNKDCVPTHKRRAEQGDSSLDVGGSGANGQDIEGGGELEIDGGDGDGDGGDDDRICCLHKGAQRPRLSNECNDKEGDREVFVAKCVGSKSD